MRLFKNLKGSCGQRSLYELLGRYTFLLLLVSAILGCKTSTLNPQQSILIKNPKNLMISEIRCLNMAEKLVGIGSKNDEILLLIYEVDANNKVSLLASTDFLIFEKEDTVGVRLNISVPLSQERLTKQFKFILLEIDTEKNKQEVGDLVKNLLTQDLDQRTIKDKVRDDDLLGIEILPTSNVPINGQLKFSGLHLFDKFDYEVEYEFK